MKTASSISASLSKSGTSSQKSASKLMKSLALTISGGLMLLATAGPILAACSDEQRASLCYADSIDELPLLYWPLPGTRGQYSESLLPFGDPWCNHNLVNESFSEEAYQNWNTLLPLQEAFQKNQAGKIYCWNTKGDASYQHVGTDIRTYLERDVLLTDEDETGEMVGKFVFPVFSGELRISSNSSEAWGSYMLIRHEIPYVSGLRPECECLRFWSLYWHLDREPLELGGAVRPLRPIATVTNLVDNSEVIQDVDHLHLTLILKPPGESLPFPDNEWSRGALSPAISRQDLPLYLGVQVDPMKAVLFDFSALSSAIRSLEYHEYMRGYPIDPDDPETDFVFKPESLLSRAEVAKIIGNLYPVPPGMVEEATSFALKSFEDLKSSDHSWFLPEVGYFVHHGIVQGRKGLYEPEGLITRAEFLKFLLASTEKFDGFDFSGYEEQTLPADIEDGWWISWLKRVKHWEAQKGRQLLLRGTREISGLMAETPVTRGEIALMLRSFRNLEEAPASFESSIVDLVREESN